MAEKKDVYETLGISKSASADEIKQAYRKLAKKYHPDLNHEPGAEQKFKEVQEAYDILSDETKKQRYDQFGWAGVDPQAGGGNPFGQGGFGGFQGGGFDDLGDIFSQFFGGGTRQQSSRQSQAYPNRGEDVYTSLRISFMDSVKGVVKNIPLTYYKKCSCCNGTGAQNPNDVETCSRCRGQGKIKVNQQALFFNMVTEQVCPDCRGVGKRIKNKCTCCNGTGYEKVKETYELKIPAGINSGRRLRLVGKGEMGKLGGECGDLYIEINVEESTTFKRDGLNIHMELPISPVDAILGASLQVPSVYGVETIVVPSGAQYGDTIKVRNKGFKDLRSESYGDFIIHLQIKIPTSLSREEKAMYEALRSKEVENHARPSESFLDKIKRMFKI